MNEPAPVCWQGTEILIVGMKNVVQKHEAHDTCQNKTHFYTSFNML